MRYSILWVFAALTVFSSTNVFAAALICELNREVQVPSSDPDLSLETQNVKIPGTLRGVALNVAGHTQVRLEVPVEGASYDVYLSWGELLTLSLRQDEIRIRSQGSSKLTQVGESVVLALESAQLRLVCSVVAELPAELVPVPCRAHDEDC